MNKDLPKVSPGNLDDTINNVQEIYYGEGNTRSEEDNLNIETKINRIFNSPNYVYKKDVLITLADKEVKKTIIGRTNSELLTFDNEVINIASIKDIKVV